MALKSPANASVRSAATPPLDAPETRETVRPGMSVASSKLAAAAPLANEALVSVTPTEAPSRLASASGEGWVDDMVARTPGS